MGHRAEQSGTLRAVGCAVSGVFNVEALVHLSVLIEKRGSHTKTGVWNIGVGVCFDSFLQQKFGIHIISLSLISIIVARLGRIPCGRFSKK
ncbi:hypothetical protein D3C71_1387990 [compost metagenome]